MSRIQLFLGLFLLFLLPPAADAQYFGRNKPKYDNFSFQVYQSPHFEIYHYLENREALNQLTLWSEQWYRMHQEVLLDTFEQRNPVIFYNNHADFQQTNSIQGSIGVGTGGVTEGFKRRVVMPIAMSNQQTNHVLGHELVHAFQYHLMTFGDSTSLRSISNIPLWMVEGLAEYMSIGRVDAHTAMWMRDAVVNEDVPALKDLNSGKYFPYRYGQAFWAFVTGVYGDTIVEPLFVTTARFGLEGAPLRTMNTGLENLSTLWQTAINGYYKPLLEGKQAMPVGKKLLSKENSGNINIAPALSPDGKHAIFLSEKNLFSIELFLADARTGKVIRQIGSTIRNGHLDAFNFIESAGTWSPDGREFAFVAFKKGENVLVIKNVDNGKTTEEAELPDVPAFGNPTWSPDGKSIVVAGLVDGQVDLYQYFLETGKVQQLTNDGYSEVQPQFSPDGQQILYSTDEWSWKNGRTHGAWTFNLALLDINTGRRRVLEVFNTANNLNPTFDQNGDILFLSNRDGFRNMYRLNLRTNQVFQLTDLQTGISGITEFAPAISAVQGTNQVLFTHFFKGNYSIYSAAEVDFLNRPVNPQAIDFTASILPPVNPEVPSIVDRNLAFFDQQPTLNPTTFKEVSYEPKFKLDYVGGGAGVGVAATGFGPTTGLSGGIDLLFSDIVGNNQLYTSLAMNGEIYDFGGQIAYVNRKRRVAWGASLSHVPFRYGGTRFVGRDTIRFNNGQEFEANEFQVITERLFRDQASLFAFFPISKVQRLESSVAFTRYSFRRDQFSVFTDDFTRPVASTDRERVDAPEGLSFGLINAAWVGDNSVFGLTSPLMGYRYRLGADRFFGSVSYTNITADMRAYQYMKPFTLAFRAMHLGRYGSRIDELRPIYNIALPWMVRGYDYGTSDLVFENNIARNQLVGNKVFVSNVELRVPFTGPKALALIGSRFLFTELALFADGGMAWNNFDEFKRDNEGNIGTGPRPIFSAGITSRINLFGALILEPFYAFPIQENTKGQFGLNILPGW